VQKEKRGVFGVRGEGAVRILHPISSKFSDELTVRVNYSCDPKGSGGGRSVGLLTNTDRAVLSLYNLRYCGVYHPSVRFRGHQHRILREEEFEQQLGPIY